MAKYNRCASEVKAELDSVQEALHLQEILRGESTKSNNPLCSCCDVCSKACKCGGCNDSCF